MTHDEERFFPATGGSRSFGSFFRKPEPSLAAVLKRAALRLSDGSWRDDDQSSKTTKSL